MAVRVGSYARCAECAATPLGLPGEEYALCTLVASCPFAFLVSTMRPESGRGRDVLRPFTIQLPLPGSGHPVE